MSHNPEFYLTSTEINPTLIPRKCWIIERLWSEERLNNFLRVQIEPPIVGKQINIDQELINEVVIATRHTNTNLYPISELPITVYICQIVDNQCINTGRVSSKNLVVMFIGEIYKTMEDAEKAIQHEKARI